MRFYGNIRPRLRAFTLIELLIVVAIIAILAAIAVPNFLEAQARAKVGRAKSDMRTVANALEIYRVDNTGYPSMLDPQFNNPLPYLSPSHLKWWYVPNVLSTPVAYLSSAALHCPFGGNYDKRTVYPGGIWYRYGYENIKELMYLAWDATPPLPILQKRYPKNYNGPDASLTGQSALTWSGEWRLQCIGPDRLWNPSVNYDASNGTVSGGDIIRTQKSPEGNIRPDNPRP